MVGFVIVLQPLTWVGVVSPTHARGGTLNLLMTDVPDLVRVTVVPTMGNSDHSSLSAVISVAQAVQTCVLI